MIKSQLKAINIDVDIVAQEPGTFASNNGIGNFEWDLTARGMRGDVDGYVNEYNPSHAIYKIVVPGVSRTSRCGATSATADHARSGQAAAAVQGRAGALHDGLPQIGLVQVKKFQVVNKRVQGMYVAFDDFNTGLRNNVWLAS